LDATMQPHARDRAARRVTGHADSKVWLGAKKVMWWRLHKLDVRLRTTFCGDLSRFGWEVTVGSVTKEAIVHGFGVGTNASFEEQALWVSIRSPDCGFVCRDSN
jgi:hypothetical protein